MKEQTLYNLFPEEEFLEYTSEAQKKEGTPLWEYWKEFVTKYLRTGKSQNTVKNVRDTLRFIIRNIKLLTFEELNNTDLFEEAYYKVTQERKISNVTYNTYLKNLNTYTMWLKKKKLISENNIPNVDKHTEEINEQYTLTKDRVKEIVAHVHERRQTRLQRLRNVFFIDLIRFTGARPCELLNLECISIREEKGTYILVIQGRKQKGRLRYYRFPSWLRDSYDAYMDYRATIRPDETFVFISSSKQGRWTEKGMRGLFRKLSEELGYKVTAYAFRRFVATYLNEQGKDLKHIQNYLGHSRVTTTQRYIERSCSLTDICANTMGNIE